VSAPADLAARYLDALDSFIARGGEDALSEAYEIGRQTLGMGHGVLEMASIHHAALARWLERRETDDPSAIAAVAGTFFAESLSSFEMHSRHVDESKAAWRRLNDLLEGEVKRIARSLHDEAGSILAHAGLEMDLATSGLDAEARERLALARQLLDDTGEQLRHLSHELRPVILDDLGLVPALEYLVEGVGGRTGLSVTVRGTLPHRSAPAVEFATYRIVQEAINNALRHGASAYVKVLVEHRAGRLHCVVSDDGVGFDVDTVFTDARSHGLGLLGMRERAAAVGGECVVKSVPGRGTSVEISVPI
jgi:signal transduction histidine kinase